MKAYEILCCEPINKVEQSRVEELAADMLNNGWKGAPILVFGNGERLLTGSHRQAALKYIEINHWDAAVLDEDVAEDVTDIIEAKAAEFEKELGYVPDIDFGRIGMWLEGSWVEQYKDDIVEW